MVVLDLVADLTADAAIGTDRVNLPVDLPAAVLGDRIDDGFRHQRAGRAGLHALSASDASGEAHRIVEVEDGLRADVAERHADHVVDLNLSTRANAQPAVDAGVEIDRHGRMRKVRAAECRGQESGSLRSPATSAQCQKGETRSGESSLRRLVGEQELHDHAARLHGAIGRRLHHHVGRRLADAGGSQNALAFDLDHAGAAIAIGAVAGLRQPAKMRDVDALALGDLPYGFAGPRSHDLAVDGEKELVGHDPDVPCQARYSFALRQI